MNYSSSKVLSACAAFAAFCSPARTVAEDPASVTKDIPQAQSQLEKIVRLERDLISLQKIIDRTKALTKVGEVNSLVLLIPSENRNGEDLSVSPLATIRISRLADKSIVSTFVENKNHENSDILKDPQRKALVVKMIEGQIGPMPATTYEASSVLAGLPLIVGIRGDVAANLGLKVQTFLPLSDDEGPIRAALLESWGRESYVEGLGIDGERTPGRLALLPKLIPDVYFAHCDSLSYIRPDNEDLVMRDFAAIPAVLKKVLEQHLHKSK